VGGADGLFQRRPEAGPSCAAVELGRRGKQVKVATRAGKIAAPFLVQQHAREGTLGRRLTKHRILVGRQQLAPLRVGAGGLRKFRSHVTQPATTLSHTPSPNQSHRASTEGVSLSFSASQIGSCNRPTSMYGASGVILIRECRYHMDLIETPRTREGAQARANREAHAIEQLSARDRTS